VCVCIRYIVWESEVGAKDALSVRIAKVRKFVTNINKYLDKGTNISVRTHTHTQSEHALLFVSSVGLTLVERWDNIWNHSDRGVTNVGLVFSATLSLLLSVILLIFPLTLLIWVLGLAAGSKVTKKRREELQRAQTNAAEADKTLELVFTSQRLKC